jgi:hypothetical protein
MKGMAHAVSVFDGVESATTLSFSKHYHNLVALLPYMWNILVSNLDPETSCRD